MLEGINTALTNAVKNVGHENVSRLLYAGAGAIACRKFLMAGGYKLAGKGAEMIGSTLAADKWNKTADETYLVAKKDAVRDLTAVAAFLGTLAVVSSVDEIVKTEKAANQGWIDWGKENLSWGWENKLSAIKSLIVPACVASTIYQNLPWIRLADDGCVFVNPCRFLCEKGRKNRYH
jgi:hypothetical protein